MSNLDSCTLKKTNLSKDFASDFQPGVEIKKRGYFSSSSKNNILIF